MEFNPVVKRSREEEPIGRAVPARHGGSLRVAAAAALVCVAAACAAGTTRAAPGAPLRPQIVAKPIPFGPKRRAETAAYAKRHYGLPTWRLEHPHVIVEHYTASSSFSSAYWAFVSDAPDQELHERPGICAHFVIDTDGTIYQLVSLKVMCRHTVGLNWTAIGIEHVGTSDRQILDNPKQMASSLALTAWLMSRYHIQLRNVIGHNESLSSPYHRERYRAWRCQTHGDWQHRDMQTYRAALARVARRDRVPLGPAARPVTPRCP